MTTTEQLLAEQRSLLKELLAIPRETEWVEFKHNNADPLAIGQYISALSNSSALIGKQFAYVVWGVNDDTHEVTGTTFQPATTRNKKQELESWLLQKCTPKIYFRFFDFTTHEGLPVVILEIPAATHTPVQFDGSEYIRVGSYTKKLRGFPEKERELWHVFDRVPFERQQAAKDLDAEDVLKRLDYPSYFTLIDMPLPENREGILNALTSEKLIERGQNGLWNILNLGAILLAKNLLDFETLSRKTVRLVQYKGNSKFETIREKEHIKGYAVGFEELIDNLKILLPSNEVIGKVWRENMPMFPELSLRELVANAIIHQDFSLTGTGPMVELFDNRLEITNPGIPLVDTQRFIDTPPQSRNEALASFMRRIGICEERGSGIDKVIIETEVYQLPAPIFENTEQHTRVVLFAHKKLAEMDTDDRIRACYQHCCLGYVRREFMNNTSLRKRFDIEKVNSAMASRIIRQTTDAGLICLYDPEANRKAYRYVPFWAR